MWGSAAGRARATSADLKYGYDQTAMAVNAPRHPRHHDLEVYSRPVLWHNSVRLASPRSRMDVDARLVV